MKNIHILPTDKPSRLSDCHDNKIHLDDVRYLRNYQNIYITNDDEIKMDEPYLGSDNNIYYLCEGGVNYNGKKIILTTDQELIDEGVQPIDDEFLEWFVKNPSCEYVMVQKGFADGTAWGYNFLDYKIIFLKNQPQFGTKEFNDLASQYFGGKPKQETLEEAFEKNAQYLDDFENKNTYEYGFRDGAKWHQERSYSEEEVKNILFEWSMYKLNASFEDGEIMDYEQWFEQNKKK